MSGQGWGPPGTPGGRPQQGAAAPGGAWQNTPAPVAPTPANYEQPFENPTYSVPGPAVNPILGHWNHPRNRIGFLPLASYGPGGTYDAIYLTTYYEGMTVGATYDNRPVSKAVWSTPTFDLMPQLRASNGASPGDTQSIWIPGMSLAVQLDFPNAYNYTNGVQVYALEWVAFVGTTEPTDVRPVSLPQELTSYCWDGWGMNLSGIGSANTPSVTLHFGPPAGARYWRLSLIFDRVPPAGIETDPVIRASGMVA